MHCLLSKSTWLSVLLTAAALTGSAQKWVYYGRVPFGKVYFDVYAKPGSWGMGQQFFGANFYNGTFYKVHVKGELFATTICGTEAVSTFDFVVDQYATKKRVDPESNSAVATGYLVDVTGLLGSCDQEICQGDLITVEGIQTRTRIHSMSVRKLKLFAIQDDGSEVPITVNGVMINPPAATGSTTKPSDPASAPSNTTQQQTPAQQTQPTQTQPTQTQPAQTTPVLTPQEQAAQTRAQAAQAALQAQAQAMQATTDLMNTGADIMQQGVNTGDNTLLYMGAGVVVLAPTMYLLLNTNLSGAGPIICYTLAGAAAAYLLIRGDHFSRHWFALKTQLGGGYEQMPALLNTGTATMTDAPQYPMLYFGLKATFFNSKGVSFSLTPFFTHSINGTDKNIDITEYAYGGNATLLAGRKNTSHLRLFAEGGWSQRNLNYTNKTLGGTGTFNYSAIRYGGGIMLWTLNKRKTRESYIRPGIFYEMPSFATSGEPPSMVANVQIMLASFVTLDCSYSKNYYIGGAVHYPDQVNGLNRDFYSLKLIKTGNIF